MKEKLAKMDWARIRFGILAAILSALVAWRFQPLVRGNVDALNTIVTVFSILAGFLIAVITIVGDGAAIARGNWRRDEAALLSIRRRLTRHKLMFQVYLLVLALVFSIQLFGGGERALPWCEYVLLFLATFAFLGSLALPGQLFHERVKKLEAGIQLPPRLDRAMNGEGGGSASAASAQ